MSTETVDKVAIPSWACISALCTASPLARGVIENAQAVERITSPLIAKGLDTADIANAVRCAAMHTVMNAPAAAWYVRDFYRDYDRLPTKDDMQ